MKATDLMIGDWVYIAHPVAPIVPRELKFDKVTGVRMEWIYAINRYGKEESYLQSYVTPIPLTEEILKANGFTINGTCCELERKGFTIRYILGSGKLTVYLKRNGKVTSKIRIFIKKVHRLQHALRLCNLNDLADNFKVDREDKEFPRAELLRTLDLLEEVIKDNEE